MDFIWCRCTGYKSLPYLPRNTIYLFSSCSLYNCPGCLFRLLQPRQLLLLPSLLYHVMRVRLLLLLMLWFFILLMLVCHSLDHYTFCYCLIPASVILWGQIMRNGKMHKPCHFLSVFMGIMSHQRAKETASWQEE